MSLYLLSADMTTIFQKEVSKMADEIFPIGRIQLWWFKCKPKYIIK